jgi:hypothetical protein
MKWRGKSRVCCCGNLFRGPVGFGMAFFLGTLALMSGCYYIIMSEVAPIIYLAGYQWLMMIFLTLSFSVLYFFLKAAFTDPGVILSHSNYE